jgi:hypothetical protein
MKTVFITLILLTTSLCKAQNWTKLFEQKNETYYFKPNSYDTAWIKVVSNKSEFFQESKKSETIDGYKVILYKYSCISRKIGIIKGILYSSEGKVVDSFSKKEAYMEMDYVNPDSIEENLLDLFCKK